jgi:hypothetical protein
MAKTKTQPLAEPENEPIKYLALKRRSEIGIGIVEKGAEVSLDGLEPEVIAWLVAKGFYRPLGELPLDVIIEMDKLAG